jgi:hypothetical protein
MLLSLHSLGEKVWISDNSVEPGTFSVFELKLGLVRIAPDLFF